MKPLADCRLYAFVDAAYLAGRTPAALAESLCDGGADIIQWRAKSWPHEKVLETARELQPILESHGVWLVINDFPDIAASVRANACHLGQEDFFGRGFHRVSELQTQGADAGKATGTEAFRLAVGLSTHSPGQARAAEAAAADYIGVGPVFATGTKPEAAPVTLDYVRWAAANITVPWFAIGGINLANLPEVLAAGARRVCVVSAILGATDVRGTCRRIKDSLTDF